MNSNTSKAVVLKHFLLFIIFILFVWPMVIFAQEPIVRVRIIKTVEPVKIKLNGDWKLNDGTSDKILDDQMFVEFNAENNLVSFNPGGNNSSSYNSIKLSPDNSASTLDIFDVPYGVGWWWEGKEDRNYEGEVTLQSTEENYLEVIVSLPVETYLKGVVPYEIGGDSPLEALKAQAVAARSEAFAALSSGLYGGRFHDLTSDVECQVFSGNKKRTNISDRAVEETKTLILTENDEVINAYYASNCGGHSEEIKNVWPDRPQKKSYIVSGRDWGTDAEIDLKDEENIRNWILNPPDSYCNPAGINDLPSWTRKNYRWEVNFAHNKITNMVSTGEYGKLIDIEPIVRGTSGRISRAKFVYEKNEIFVDGELKIRLLFSPPLKSSCFIVYKDENGFTLKGAGWGHGVGMCQSGAVAQAMENKNFKEILKHYYKKAELKSAY